MADSFDDEGPPDGRSTWVRVVEGLCVVAFVVAIIVWQSDGTLRAARNLVAAWGLGSPTDGPGTTDAPPSDIRLAGEAADLDPASTGSVGAAVPPLSVSASEAVAEMAPSASPGWQAACDGGTPPFCTVSQSLALAADPALETSWTIERDKDGLFAVWTTPTDVMVSRGMTLILGEAAPKTVPYDACGPHSCEVRARLTADFLSLLRKSGSVRTQIVLRGGRTITFDFAQDGLTAALDRLGA